MFIHTIATRRWSNVNVIRETKNKEIAIRGGESPRRYGHACVLYNGRIYMFGGRNDDDGMPTLMIAHLNLYNLNVWLIMLRLC